MPLYTYKCTKCGHETEVLVIGNRGEPKQCPKCGAKKLERRFGRFSCGGGSSGGSSKSSCDAGSCAPT